jgi:hypothetical protein
MFKVRALLFLFITSKKHPTVIPGMLAGRSPLAFKWDEARTRNLNGYADLYFMAIETLNLVQGDTFGCSG